MKAAASKIFPFEILRWIVESCDIISDTHNTVTTDLNMELSISCDIFWCWDLVKMFLDIEIWNVYMLNVQDFCIDMMLCDVERDGTWEVCPICPSTWPGDIWDSFTMNTYQNFPCHRNYGHGVWLYRDLIVLFLIFLPWIYRICIQIYTSSYTKIMSMLDTKTCHNTRDLNLDIRILKTKRVYLRAQGWCGHCKWVVFSACNKH